MKKSIKLLSFLAITSLLSCASEVIKQNVTINNDIKPTPSVSKLPIEIKPSPIESLKIVDYSKIIFSLKDEYNENKPFQETISEAPIFDNIEKEEEYYNKTKEENPRNYKNYPIYLDLNTETKLELSLIYLDGKSDSEYTIEIPEKFKTFLELRNGNLYGIKEGFVYIKVYAKKNKDIFKFFYLNINTTDSNCSCEASPDIKEKATFNGKVVDPSSIPVKGAKVSAKAIDPGVYWSGTEKITDDKGEYIFRNAPVGARLLITVTKDGWVTRERMEVVKTGLQDATANRFDFDGVYALQDEPEITSLKVNGKSATATGPSLKPDIENLSNAPANLSALDNSKLEVEMTFSEPVITSDIENYFRVTSEDFEGKKNNHIVIDKNTEGIKFELLENNQKVKISLNKQLIANRTGNEVKYLLEFTQPFRDLTNKEARAKHYIRFNPANEGDFHVFSIQNDTIKPKLLSIIALDGKDNDIIELTFNKPMNYWGFKSNILALEYTKNKVIYQTDAINSNNATILGYSKEQESLKLNDFVAIYSIGKILKTSDSTIKVFPLDINNVTYGSLINGNSIISAKISDNKVKLELPSTVFNKGEQIVLSLGGEITGDYESNNKKFPININLVGIEKGLITDVIGNLMSKGTSSLENNVTINDLQKTAIVQ